MTNVGFTGVHGYTTAENAGLEPLIANRTQIGPWERFLLEMR